MQRGPPAPPLLLLLRLLLLPSLSSAAAVVPPSLRSHLQLKLARAFATPPPPASADTDTTDEIIQQRLAAAASRLVEELVSHAPPEGAAAWAQANGDKVTRLVQANATAGFEMQSGRLSVLEAIAAAEERTRESIKMFEAVQGHHAALRETVQAPKAGAWESATADRGALQRYGEAATDVGTRQWARRGIDWCVSTAREHFHGDAAVRRARKHAARDHFRAHGEVIPSPAADALCARLAEAVKARRQEGGPPIRLLDVGSCGFLFDGVEGFECTALDLCPQDERTYEADFLRLRVGPRGSAPPVRGNDDDNDDGGAAAKGVAAAKGAAAAEGVAAEGAAAAKGVAAEGAAAAEGPRRMTAGTLEALPAASFDVAVFSLVFSYLPLAEQRAAMVVQARRLLRVGGAFPGLLLIVDTFSALGSRSGALRRGSVIDEWVATIEGLGFECVTQQTLERSHALAFAAVPLRAPLDDDRLGAEARSALSPEAVEEVESEVAAELAARAAGVGLHTRADMVRRARAEAMGVTAAELEASFSQELRMKQQREQQRELRQRARRATSTPRTSAPTMRLGERPTRRSVLSGGVAASLATATALPASATKSRDGYPVQRTYDAWQAGLSEQQFYILREGGTEPQFSSPLLREKAKGIFRCAGCDAALFDSSAKFDSGTGWPSFSNALPDVEVVSGIGGVAQTAVLGAECRCGRCGGHLGDLFLDGFLFVGSSAMLSGKRYCIDGAALTFAPDSAKSDRVYGEGCVVGKRCIASKGTIERLEAARATW